MHTVSRFAVMALVLGVSPVAAGQDLEGTFAISFEFRAMTEEAQEDADGVWLRKAEYHRTATMTCPVFTSGEDMYSQLSLLLPGNTTGMPAEGRFETWYSENCAGEMTVDERVTLSKGATTIVRERIHGTRALSDVDANITAETDLDTMHTRYAIVPAQASGFARESDDGRTSTGPIAATPEGQVVAGPFAGPVQSGSYARKLKGGQYDIQWTFTRNG